MHVPLFHGPPCSNGQLKFVLRDHIRLGATHPETFFSPAAFAIIARWILVAYGNACRYIFMFVCSTTVFIVLRHFLLKNVISSANFASPLSGSEIDSDRKHVFDPIRRCRLSLRFGASSVCSRRPTQIFEPKLYIARSYRK